MATVGVAALQLSALFRNGAAVPLVWIIGVILLVGGVISMVRGGVILGIVLVIFGVLLGGLQLL